MIALGQYEETAENVRAIYEEAERKMVEAISKRAARGLNATNWQAQKLSEIKDARAEIEKTLKQLQAERGDLSQETVLAAYNDASAQCKTDIQRFTDSLNITHKLAESHPHPQRTQSRIRRF